MVGLIVLSLFGGLITWWAIYVITRETPPVGPLAASYKLECVRDNDGRFVAEIVPEVPGSRAWGATAEEAMAKAQAAVLRVLAERLEQGEVKARAIHIELRGPATTTDTLASPT